MYTTVTILCRRQIFVNVCYRFNVVKKDTRSAWFPVASLHSSRSCNRVIRNSCAVEMEAIRQVTQQIPVKSANDIQDYRIITLTNGLIALLIADNPLPVPGNNGAVNPQPETEKTAGCEGADIAKDRNGAGQDSRHTDSDDWETEESSCSESGTSADEIEESGDSGSARRTRRARKRRDSKEETGKRSAVALSINVGSFSDPSDIPGLAHFLEHMIFMGSKKYPKENEFDSYVTSHGGSSNAFTDLEYTVFHFDVHSRFLSGALDRFAQSFIAPLLATDSVDREIEAVDSEFQMSLTSDACRIEQLIASTADPTHPMAKFCWGNKDSLDTYPKSNGVDVYERLKEFCAHHYVAANMKLVIISRESLDNLETIVRGIFESVPTSLTSTAAVSHNKNEQAPFDNAEFNRIYKVVPVKNTNQVYLTWPLPPLLHQYKVKPLLYLSWLFGHESKGSISSYLKKRHWALDIESSGDESIENNSTCAMVNLVITLTKDGLDNIHEVILTVFQYIQLMQKLGPQKSIFDEIKLIRENEFRWKEQDEPQDYAEELACCMQLYPPEDFLTGNELLVDYNEQLLADCSAKLTPSHVNIVVLAENFKTSGICDKKEKWFQTEYTVEDPALNAELYLPLPNQFIAKDFSLKTADMPETEYPVLISSTNTSRLFYKKDIKFKVPRAQIIFCLKSKSFSNSALSRCIADMFVKLLSHNLEEVAYDAKMAELEYNLKLLEHGLEISLSGFNDKLVNLFRTIVDHIVDFKVEPKLFETIRQEEHMYYYNQCIKPETFCKDMRLSVMLGSHWTMAEKSHELDSITLESLTEHVKSMSYFVEGLVQGNITAAEAKGLEQYLLTRISTCPELALPASLVTKLKTTDVHLKVKNMNPDDNNCLVVNYYQHGPGDLKEEVLIDLLLQHMYEPCFDELRSQQQLGYLVSCGPRNMHNVLGYTVTVGSQSKKHTVKQIDKQIELFLQKFSKSVQKMKPNRFQCLVDSEISTRRCEDCNLTEEVEYNWEEILWQTYLFDGVKREIGILEKLTLKEFQTWAKSHLLAGSAQRRKLAIHVVGRPDKKGAIKRKRENSETSNVTQENTKSDSKPTAATLQSNAAAEREQDENQAPGKVMNGSSEKHINNDSVTPRLNGETREHGMESANPVTDKTHENHELQKQSDSDCKSSNGVTPNSSPLSKVLRIELDPDGSNCVTDLEKFKKERETYPVYQPVIPESYPVS